MCSDSPEGGTERAHNAYQRRYGRADVVAAESVATQEKAGFIEQHRHVEYRAGRTVQQVETIIPDRYKQQILGITLFWMKKSAKF